MLLLSIREKLRKGFKQDALILLLLRFLFARLLYKGVILDGVVDGVLDHSLKFRWSHHRDIFIVDLVARGRSTSATARGQFLCQGLVNLLQRRNSFPWWFGTP